MRIINAEDAFLIPELPKNPKTKSKVSPATDNRIPAVNPTITATKLFSMRITIRL